MTEEKVDLTRAQYQEELIAAVHEGMIAGVVIQINACLGAGIDRERLLAVCNTALQEPSRIMRV